MAASILLSIQNGPNRHWLTRAKSNTTWTILKKLGTDDLLVELTVSDAARADDRLLPKTYIVRAIGYQIDKSKPKQWFLTSLVDRALYPARDIIALYHERWRD